MPRRDDAAPLKSITVFAKYAAHTAAAMGSSCGEEACGLFGELFSKTGSASRVRNPAHLPLRARENGQSGAAKGLADPLMHLWRIHVVRESRFVLKRLGEDQ